MQTGCGSIVHPVGGRWPAYQLGGASMLQDLTGTRYISEEDLGQTEQRCSLPLSMDLADPALLASIPGRE